MRLTFNSFSRIIAVFLMVVGLGFGFASQTLAKTCAPGNLDNDCDGVNVCNFSVGGAKLGKVESAKTNIFFNRKDNSNNYFYDVSVCNLDSIASVCAPPRSVVMAYQYTGLWWQYLTLTKGASGCYTGELKVYAPEGVEIQFDVELDNSSSTCAAKKLPLCARTYGILRTSSAADIAACTAAETSIKGECNAISFETTQMIMNEPVNFSVDIPSVLGDRSCNLKPGKATIELFNPSNESIMKETIDAADFGNKDYTFTPSMLASCGGAGGYRIELKTYLPTDIVSLTSCKKVFGVGTAENPCDAPEPGVDLLVDKKFKICEQIVKDTNPLQYQRCQNCMAGTALEDTAAIDSDSTPDVPVGIWTAVGCIKADPQSIIITLVKIGLGVAGGGALLMILSASFVISTSAGDAKKFTEAKEMISNALIGLVFIIMSVTILQFIGVTLFHIPGFGEP